MRVVVFKNDKESNERLITRFNKKVQGSRKIVLVRNERYYEKPLTKRLERTKAIMRENYRAKREKNKFYGN